MNYAFDTNIIIHLIRGTQSVRENRDKAYKSGSRFVIPPFVNYEVKRGHRIKSIPLYEKAYTVICANCSLEEMTNSDLGICFQDIC